MHNPIRDGVLTLDIVTEPRAVYDYDDHRVWAMFGTRGPWVGVGPDGSVTERYTEPAGYTYPTDAEAAELAEENYDNGVSSGHDSGYDEGADAARAKIETVLDQHIDNPAAVEAIMNALDEAL